MSVETMANPIDKIKKIKGKSWSELRARSEQAFSVYSEQIGLSGKLPSDEEMPKLFDKNQTGAETITPELLFDIFCENSEYGFFPAFRQKEKTIEIFRSEFGEKNARVFIEKADRMIHGKFDLLGYLNLDFGAQVDWHYEPVSGKHTARKHWKQFDELDSTETGDKKIIWELNRHQHFFTLGVAFWLTKDERYALAFARHIDSWMEQNPPGVGINWFSSLEVSLRAISWIWALNFFADSKSLTAELFQKILKYLYVHGRHIEKYLSTFYSPNTHLTGEALGLFYLGTQLPFFERSAHWRKLGEDILFAELDRQILPDGVYFEQSTWYQRYTADFYTQFLILKTLSADDDPKKNLQEKLGAKLQSALDFMMYSTRPDGTTPFIGDDDGGRSLPQSNGKTGDFRYCLASGAILFERADYKFVAGEFTEETLWLLGAEGRQSFENLRAVRPSKASESFPDGGYFVMRDGWADTDNYLLVDCGEVGALNGGHGHADALGINLSVAGSTKLVDSGTYTYHESDELRDFFRTTIGHNTLTVDNKSQSEPGGKFNWKTRAKSKLRSWISQDRFDFFEGSHDGYERLSDAATHTRSILFLKNDYWIMRDLVETTGEHEYGVNFHFNAKTNPSLESAENGNLCISETNGLRLFTFGDNGNWQRKESWISDCYGKRVNAPFLRFVSKGAGTQEFFTFMLPNELRSAAPEVFETEVAGGRAFVINYLDYQDIFVFTDGGQVVRTEFFNTNFKFLWARLSHGETTPEEFVLVGGTNFSLGGREVINYPNKLDFAIARRLGNRLNVRTSESVFSVSLPQKNQPNTF
jgi:hypothetical protein